MNTVKHRSTNPVELILFVLVVAVIASTLCFNAFGQTSIEKRLLFCFTQKGCPQCAAIKPTWEKLRKSNRVILIDLDDDKYKMFESMKIEQTPTTVFVSSGPGSHTKEHWRFVGVKTDKEIEAKIAEIK